MNYPIFVEAVSHNIQEWVAANSLLLRQETPVGLQHKLQYGRKIFIFPFRVIHN